jgi:hypothetical protein
MSRERVGDSLSPNVLFQGRRNFLRRFIPRFPGQPESNDQPRYQRLLHARVPRRTILAGSAVIAGKIAYDSLLPTTFPIPFLKPTENQNQYRPVEGTLLSADSEEFSAFLIAHRAGNTYDAMETIKNIKGNGIDLDLSKVIGILDLGDEIYVGHGVQVADPITGIPMIGIDRASGKMRLGGARTFDEVMETAKSLNMKIASAELKREDYFFNFIGDGGFTQKDVTRVHEKARQLEMTLVLNSPSYEVVTMAYAATGMREACYFRPETVPSRGYSLASEEQFDAACEEGFGLFTDVNIARQKQDMLVKFKTPVVIGSVYDRSEVDDLLEMGINITAFFNNAPDLQKVFGVEAES